MGFTRILRRSWLASGVGLLLALTGLTSAKAGPPAGFCQNRMDLQVSTPSGGQVQYFAPDHPYRFKLFAWSVNVFGRCQPGFTTLMSYTVKVYLGDCGYLPIRSGSAQGRIGQTPPWPQVAELTFTMPRVCPPGSAYPGRKVQPRGSGWVDLSGKNFDSLALVTPIFWAQGGSSQQLPAAATAGGRAAVGLLSDPVVSATGSFARAESDVSLAARGASLDFWRSYNSQQTRLGPFGPGWTSAFGDRLYVDPATKDASWVDSYGATQVFTYLYPDTFVARPGTQTELTRKPDRSWELTMVDQYRLKFAPTGLLTSIVDRSQHTTLISRNPRGQMTQVASSGRKLGFAYTSSGQLASVTATGDRPGAKLTTSYDYRGGNLMSVVRPGGLRTAYTYDAKRRLVSVRKGKAIRPQLVNHYAANGRVDYQLDALGHKTTFSWAAGPEAGSGTATMVDPRGGTWRDAYERGWLVRSTDPTGAFTTFDWTEDGDLWRVADTTGKSTEFTYDAYHHVTGRQGPTGVSDSTYRELGETQPSSKTDFLGQETSFGYDGRLNLTRITQAGHSGSYNYSPKTFDLASVVNPLGEKTSYAYSTASGDLTGVTNAIGERTAFTRDGFGQVTSVTPGPGTVAGASGRWAATITRDQAGRPSVMTDANSGRRSVAYDDRSNVVRSVDPQRCGSAADLQL
jgi:YD repeat-containing protein